MDHGTNNFLTFVFAFASNPAEKDKIPFPNSFHHHVRSAAVGVLPTLYSVAIFVRYALLIRIYIDSFIWIHTRRYQYFDNIGNANS